MVVRFDVTRDASAPVDGPLFARFDDLSLVLFGATTNAVPIANPDFIAVTAGGVATRTRTGGNLLSNDFELDADALRVNPIPVIAPSHGLLMLGTDGTFRYENTAVALTDRFTYEVCDGKPGGCDRAEVLIDIEPDTDVFSSGFESTGL